MPLMQSPVAAASIAFDFPVGIIAALATLLLGSIAVVAFIDWRRTSEKKRLEQEQEQEQEQE